MKKKYITMVFIVVTILINVTIFVTLAMAEKIKWRMVTCWPSFSGLHSNPVRLAKNIYELSGGRLQITVHPAGELVSLQAVFDTVSKGSVEMGSDWPSYWAGKNSAFDLLGAYPMTLSQHDVINWYLFGGGKEMYNYMYGKYNMIYFINGVIPTQSCIRSRVPIRGLADLRGKKIRQIGKAAGYILQKAGAVPVAIAPNEISQQIMTGAIDGAIFNTPANDLTIGLAEVTKYNIGPGWNMPSATGGIMINKDAWNSLPPDLKKIIEIAISENGTYMSSLSEWSNIDAISTFREKGTVVTKFSDKELKQIEEWTWEFIIDEAAKNPDFDKVATSMFQYLKDFGEVREYQAPFSHGRNPSTIPKLPHLK